MPLVSIENKPVDQTVDEAESRGQSLQTELADCFLSSWTFTLGGAAIGLLRSHSQKTFVPVAYGVLAGTVADVLSGCYRCQEQWEALRKHQASLQRPKT